MWKIQVQSLGQEDPLEKEMATHSSILAWRIPWTGETTGLPSKGLQRVGHNQATNTVIFIEEWLYFKDKDEGGQADRACASWSGMISCPVHPKNKLCKGIQ